MLKKRVLFCDGVGLSEEGFNGFNRGLDVLVIIFLFQVNLVSNQSRLDDIAYL